MILPASKRYGRYVLPEVESGKQFRAPPEAELDTIQKTLLDNLWVSNGSHKINPLNALRIYFSNIKEKPLSKSFSCFAVSRGRFVGLLTQYADVKRAIEEISHSEFRGFYQVADALNYLQQKLGFCNFYVDHRVNNLTPQREEGSSSSHSNSEFDNICKELECVKKHFQKRNAQFFELKTNFDLLLKGFQNRNYLSMKSILSSNLLLWSKLFKPSYQNK